MCRSSPSWICEITAKLVLNNSSTGEKYEYELQGVGEEPLAEDNVVIKCQARDKVAQELVVKNTKKKPIVFSVESDLPHVSGGTCPSAAAHEQLEHRPGITARRTSSASQERRSTASTHECGDASPHVCSEHELSPL